MHSMFSAIVITKHTNMSANLTNKYFRV